MSLPHLLLEVEADRFMLFVEEGKKKRQRIFNSKLPHPGFVQAFIVFAKWLVDHGGAGTGRS